MDFFDLLLAKKLADGGGSSTTVEELSVTENGTYEAEQGKAFSPVTVNVSGGGIELASVTCHIILSEELEQAGVTGAMLYLQGFGEFEEQLSYGNGFQCSNEMNTTMLVPKNIPNTKYFIERVNTNDIGFFSGSSGIEVSDAWIRVADSDCIDEENGAVIKDGNVTIEVGAEI